jgi:hypothetical protein
MDETEVTALLADGSQTSVARAMEMLHAALLDDPANPQLLNLLASALQLSVCLSLMHRTPRVGHQHYATTLSAIAIATQQHKICMATAVVGIDVRCMSANHNRAIVGWVNRAMFLKQSDTT